MSARTALFPGSFDPLTNGHVDVISRALKTFDNLIVAVLFNPAKQTLFTVDERVAVISEALADFKSRVQVKSFSGLLVDFARAQKTNVIIRGLRAISDYDYEMQMALMNKSLSEEIETFFLMTREENSYISSTTVKQVAMLGGSIEKFVPHTVARAVKSKIEKKQG